MFKRLTTFLLVALSLLTGALTGCTSSPDQPEPSETATAALAGGYDLATLVAALQGYGIAGYDPALGTPDWDHAYLETSDERGPIVIVPIVEGDRLRAIAALATPGQRGNWTFDTVIAEVGFDEEFGDYYPDGEVQNLDGTARAMVDDELDDGGGPACLRRCLRAAQWACILAAQGYAACLVAATSACVLLCR